MNTLSASTPKASWKIKILDFTDMAADDPSERKSPTVLGDHPVMDKSLPLVKCN